MKKNPKTGSGYTFMTKKKISEFHIMHEMPIALNLLCCLDDGDGIVSTLVSSKARYMIPSDSSLTIQNLSAHKKARSAKGTRVFLIAFANGIPFVVKVEKQLLSM